MARDKTFIEFFAGIGLVHQALRPSGWQCLYANDIDPHKERIYRGHFGSADYWHRGDVWHTEEALERITSAPFLATASFPCTDMSLAGNMRGFAGRESSAFFGFAEVLERLGPRRPRLVLLENVLGLLTSRGGAGFAATAQRLAELGYWVDAWRLDARHFLPQSRPRLFLAGYAEPDDRLVNERHPQWEAVLHADEALRPARLRERISETPLSTGWTLAPLPSPPALAVTLDELIDVDSEQDWWDAQQTERHAAMMNPAHQQRVEQWRVGTETRVATAFRRIREGEQRMEVRFDGVAGCLRTPRGGSARQIVLAAGRGELRLRWMSPREYARLQGAGDYRWPVETAASRVLFGFGDAVCVPAVKWIDDHLLTPYYLSEMEQPVG